MEHNISTYNCRGLRDGKNRKKLFEWLKGKRNDIIMMQETHSTKTDEVIWRAEWGGDICFAHGKKDSKGVMILFKDKYNIKILEVNSDGGVGRVLYVTVEIDGTEILLVNIYAPNEDNPDFFHTVFKKISEINKTHCIVGGDYNLVLNVNLDKEGGRLITNEKAQRCVKEYMKTLEMVDVWRVKHSLLREYTWRRRRPSVIQCRLDFFLTSQGILNMTQGATIGTSFISDHSIVTLSLKLNNVMRGTGYWKLNCSMLQEKDYVECIKDTIKECEIEYENDNIDKVLFWEILKMKIRGTSIKYACNKKRNDRNLVLDLEKKVKTLEQTNLLSDIEKCELERYRTELNDVLDKKIKGEMIRSRAKVYEEGEKSSKYFLSLEKCNQAKKVISQLQDDKGNVTNKHGEICEIIASYYKKLYEKNVVINPDNVEEDFFRNVQKCLSPSEKDTCEGLIGKQELLTALEQTNNNRSPGIDGIPVDFYKVFWINISDHLVEAMNVAFQNGELSSNHRRGIITLIPKKGKDSMLIKNWRPITLLCSDYKLVSKVIANRIKTHLPKLIDSDQNGFVKNRYIGQNIDLLCQIIEYTEDNNIPSIILTTDYEKAFDTLNWRFIEEVLKKLNFGTMLQKWVKLFYSNVSSVVNVNGWFTKPFAIEKGVKQGDPLSPYLFILCAEILAENIRRDNDVKGIKIGKVEHKISMLADDTNIFLQYCEASLNAVLTLLDKFSLLSGLRINYDKSVAYCIGVKHSKRLKTMFPIKWSEDVIETLGVKIPLYDRNKLFVINYEPKIAAMENIIKTWSMRNLSLRGKVTVMKSLLISKFQYLVSVLGIPDVQIIRKIDKAVFSFLWDGSEKLKRKVMINLKEQGGLDVPDFETICKCAMIKWVYRYLHSEESRWKQMVSFTLKTLGGSYLFKCNLSKTEKVISKIRSSLWKCIVQSWCDMNFKKSTFIKPEDVIWFNSNLDTMLYNRECIDKGVYCVSNIIVDHNILTHTEFCDINNVHINILEYQKIVYTLKGKYESQCTTDIEETSSDKEYNNLISIIFCNPNNKLLGRKIYRYLVTKKAESDSVHGKWSEIIMLQEESKILFGQIEKMTIVNKLRSFQFKFLHKILFFNNKLFKWKLVSSTLCDFCNEALDSIEHRFFYCRITQEFWRKLELWLKDEYGIECTINNIHFIITNLNPQMPLVEKILLNAKYYVYKCFLNKSNPDLAYFKGILTNVEKTERYIATQKGLLDIHEKKWKRTL